MQVSIRNKWVTLGGSSVVKDLNEQDVLKVKGKVFTFTRKKLVNDLEGNLIYTVRNKFWRLFAHKAFIYDKEGNVVANIRRKVISLHDHYFVESKVGQIEIKGNILCFDYHISLNGEEVGHVSRKISLRDSYVLDLKDGLELSFFVALVIAIDNITDRRREDSSTVTFGD